MVRSSGVDECRDQHMTKVDEVAFFNIKTTPNCNWVYEYCTVLLNGFTAISNNFCSKHATWCVRWVIPRFVQTVVASSNFYMEIFSLEFEKRVFSSFIELQYHEKNLLHTTEIF